MAGNISKILAKYLKSSVFERDEYFLCLCDAFSKVIGNVSKGSIVELVECCLCLSHVFFYFSSIHIEEPRTKLSIFLVLHQEEEVRGKRTIKVERACALSRETVFSRINLPR